MDHFAGFILLSLPPLEIMCDSQKSFSGLNTEAQDDKRQALCLVASRGNFILNSLIV